MIVGGTIGDDKIMFAKSGTAVSDHDQRSGFGTSLDSKDRRIRPSGERQHPGRQLDLAAAWLFGGDGDDKLIGGGGNNVLIGGDGVDSLTGGNARDLLTAGG